MVNSGSSANTNINNNHLNSHVRLNIVILCYFTKIYLLIWYFFTFAYFHGCLEGSVIDISQKMGNMSSHVDFVRVCLAINCGIHQVWTDPSRMVGHLSHYIPFLSLHQAKKGANHMGWFYIPFTPIYPVSHLSQKTTGIHDPIGYIISHGDLVAFC